MNRQSAARRIRRWIGLSIAFPLLVAGSVLFAAGSAQANATYSISGQVSLGTAATPAGAGDVEVYSSQGVDPPYATTDANGNYTISGLAIGSYYLYFRYVGSGSFSGQWWGGEATVSQVSAQDEISVGPGLSTSDENITLPPSQLFSGHVSLWSAETSAGAGLTIRWTVADEVGGSPETGSTETDSSGNYSVVVAAGNYAFTFTAPSTGYQSVGVDQIMADSPVTLNEDLPSLATISGHVSLGPSDLSAGAGEVGVSWACGGEPEGFGINCSTSPSPTVYTDADGNYTIGGINTAAYIYVTFTYAVGSTYQPVTSVVEVIDPTAAYTGVNVNLPDAAVISGVVSLGTSGQVAPAGSVTVYADGQSSFSTTTTADGSYDLAVPSGDYKLEFVYNEGDEYANAWWASGGTVGGFQNDATVIVAGEVPVPGEDITLPTASYITGAVSTSSGAALTAPDVLLLYGPNGEEATGTMMTNSDGSYSLGPLVPGDYRVEFFDEFGPDAPTYVGSTVADPGNVETIDLTAGETVSDADAVGFVNSSAMLSVTCTDCTAPVYGQARVYLQRQDPDTGSWQEVDPLAQDLPSEYYFPELVPGTYRAVAADESSNEIFEAGPSFDVEEGQQLSPSFAVTIPTLRKILFTGGPEIVTFLGFGSALDDIPDFAVNGTLRSEPIMFGPVAPGEISPAAAR